jgi:hypothetical protein
LSKKGIESNLYNTTFSDEFMRLLNSYKLYGYSSKRDFVEHALRHYKINYKNNINKLNLMTILQNMMNDNLKIIENQTLINAKNIYFLDLLFYELFFSDRVQEGIETDRNELNIIIEMCQEKSKNKVKEIIEVNHNHT